MRALCSKHKLSAEIAKCSKLELRAEGAMCSKYKISAEDAKYSEIELRDKGALCSSSFRPPNARCVFKCVMFSKGRKIT